MGIVVNTKLCTGGAHQQDEDGRKIFPSIVRSNLFGHLVKLAVPQIKSYHSDLYHDAHWIERNVQVAEENETMSFWFSPREMGTSIGEDRSYVETGSEHLYYGLIYNHNGDWELLIIQIS
jgi:hypothetical protein